MVEEMSTAERRNLEQLSRELKKSAKAVRSTALIEAAGDVCPECRHGSSKPDGPNDSGNYTHLEYDGVALCPASVIWSRINFEDSEKDVSESATDLDKENSDNPTK